MSTSFSIPFNGSSLLGREQEYIVQAVAFGQIGGDQSFKPEYPRKPALRAKHGDLSSAANWLLSDAHLRMFLWHDRRSFQFPLSWDTLVE